MWYTSPAAKLRATARRPCELQSHAGSIVAVKRQANGACPRAGQQCVNQAVAEQTIEGLPDIVPYPLALGNAPEKEPYANEPATTISAIAVK